MTTKSKDQKQQMRFSHALPSKSRSTKATERSDRPAARIVKQISKKDHHQQEGAKTVVKSTRQAASRSWALPLCS